MLLGLVCEAGIDVHIVNEANNPYVKNSWAHAIGHKKAYTSTDSIVAHDRKPLNESDYLSHINSTMHLRSVLITPPNPPSSQVLQKPQDSPFEKREKKESNTPTPPHNPSPSPTSPTTPLNNSGTTTPASPWKNQSPSCSASVRSTLITATRAPLERARLA